MLPNKSNIKNLNDLNILLLFFFITQNKETLFPTKLILFVLLGKGYSSSKVSVLVNK